MILGLDFDGVMHPVSSTTEPKFCRLELLEAWLRAHPSVDVVITSSWRQVHPLHEMRSYFAEDLQSRILGATPLAHRLVGRGWTRTPEEAGATCYERQAELEAWLREAKRHDPWIALDDDLQLFEPRLARLVLCDSNTGLTLERLAQLHALASDVEFAWRHVTTDADILNGLPVFRGTRMPIETVVASLDNGIGLDNVQRSYAFVNDELVNAARAYMRLWPQPSWTMWGAGTHSQVRKE